MPITIIDGDKENLVLDANRRWYQKPIAESTTQAYRAQAQALDNEDLFEEYTSYAGGDDYDGCYTRHGRVIWEELQTELTRRLTICGFFKE